VNWEYLVQAAEYTWVYAAVSPKGYLIAVEDRLMDITVSDADGALRWYIEAKERATDVPHAASPRPPTAASSAS
jgi:hypothetical protein